MTKTMAKAGHLNGGPKPTQEEIEMQAKRAFIQKRNSIAENLLSNAVASGKFDAPADGGRLSFTSLVDAALEAADYYMEKAFNVEITK